MPHIIQATSSPGFNERKKEKEHLYSMHLEEVGRGQITCAVGRNDHVAVTTDVAVATATDVAERETERLKVERNLSLGGGGGIMRM